MASKATSLFSISLLILLSLLSYSAFSDSHDNKHSPFEFLNHLQGCHKGEKVKGVHELKKYLEKFGYLNYKTSANQTHLDDDDFDEILESALKTYQLNYHLNVTGVLDTKTVSKMSMSRCAMADIVNGTTRMLSGKKAVDHHGSTHFHKVSHFSFFEGNPKWPSTKYHLTYAFLPGIRVDAVKPVRRAFATWAANTHFTFSWTRNISKADITISFESGDHGDGYPFDGPGGTLAHAYAPTDGRFHYDAEETWSVGATPGAYDLETLALHEIGHLLGLHHSSVEDVVMAPTFSPGQAKVLHGDDIQGIKPLYNV
ncbi:metalloendoproteinase 2-MMP-like [Pistacia vera]|uniref:metalloendoproteinase 2-MMP-like n=1 Tax=Pistacia vera TaxID=55513 RepID=UPI001262F006|nr:metalloendoproteinase 2-MMP-like [Pistacia vera]